MNFFVGRRQIQLRAKVGLFFMRQRSKAEGHIWPQAVYAYGGTADIYVRGRFRHRGIIEAKVRTVTDYRHGDEKWCLAQCWNF